MKQPLQPDLFGGDLPSALPGQPPSAAPAPAQAMVRISAPAATLSKAQREFNRLIVRIERLRLELGSWQAAHEQAAAREAGEVAPLQNELRLLQRETLLWIDAFLARPAQRGEPKLTKKLRLKLIWMLLYLARAVLAEGADEAVEAAHDRHASQTHQEEQREQAELAAAMLGSALGDDRLFEGPAASVEELLARATERMQAHAQAGEGDAAAAPGRTAKALARDAQALQEANQSLREVYRRLASSLHPDRESDPAERTRKTALMSRVNEAYGRNDLLELLSVQMAIEQIDAEHLRGVSDGRLRHYVLVLKEQEQTLLEEIGTLQAPLVAHLEQQRYRTRQLAPVQYDAMVDDRLDDLRGTLQLLETDAALLREAPTRRAFLSELEIDDPDEEIDPLEALMLEQALSEAMVPMRPPVPRRGRR